MALKEDKIGNFWSTEKVDQLNYDAEENGIYRFYSSSDIIKKCN